MKNQDLNIHENNVSDSSDSDCSIGSSDHMSDHGGPESPDSNGKHINFDMTSQNEKEGDTTISIEKLTSSSVSPHKSTDMKANFDSYNCWSPQITQNDKLIKPFRKSTSNKKKGNAIRIPDEKLMLFPKGFLQFEDVKTEIPESSENDILEIKKMMQDYQNQFS